MVVLVSIGFVHIGGQMMPQVGQQIDVWFPGGVVIAVEPYRGKYPQWFSWTVRVTATRTERGWLEVCV